MKSFDYNKLALEKFNLEATLLGGQSFNWDFDPSSQWFYGFTTKNLIKLKKDKDTLLWQTYPEKDDSDLIKRYLRLDVDYNLILEKISKDKIIKNAIEALPNIRILKQDLDQTLISFLLSSNKNIKAIRYSVRLLSNLYGNKLKVDDKEISLFPSIDTLSTLSLDDLLKTKIGFRAKYVMAASKKLTDINLLQNLENSSELKTKELLKEFKGIGDKIADCIMAFSLSFDNVTPFDIWAKRVVTDLYGLNPKLKYEEISNWSKSYFNGYAAWAGQFLFEYIRNL